MFLRADNDECIFPLGCPVFVEILLSAKDCGNFSGKQSGNFSEVFGITSFNGYS